MTTDSLPPEPRPDPRVWVLRAAAVACWAWGAGALFFARVMWRGVLLAVGGHAWLVGGILFATAIVVRRRQYPSSKPIEEADPGTPRSRVPRLEASASALLIPTSIAIATAIAGWVYILPERSLLSTEAFGLVVWTLLGGAGAGLLGRYLRSHTSDLWPESAGLQAWLRSFVWMVALAAASLGAHGLGRPWGEVELSLGMFGLVLLLSFEPLLRALPGVFAWWVLREGTSPRQLAAADALVVRALFSRANPIASVFDLLDEGLGIDLRSGWALTFLRRAVEPLAVAVVVLGWLTTSLSMVHLDEAAVLERFGVPVPDLTLAPGLHVTFPWPMDRLQRVSTGEIRTLTIGEQPDEPVPDALAQVLDARDGDDALALDERAQQLSGRVVESRMWARQHADKEYTLLLGDGRDLVTIDALVHYRVADVRAWTYGMQNPEDALRSLAYRAVMQHIIAQTLDGALGQDFGALTKTLETRIQAEADAMELGIAVVDVTLGALHPPVSVAEDYQAVVSAQISRETDRIEAEAYREGRLSDARTAAVQEVGRASAEATTRRAGAVGEAAAFLGLSATVRTDEAGYRFRRRLTALETNLRNQPLVLVDARIEQDGATLWWVPTDGERRK